MRHCDRDRSPHTREIRDEFALLQGVIGHGGADGHEWPGPGPPDAACMADCPVPCPPQGCNLDVGSQFGSQNDRKGAGIRTVNCAPSGTRTYGLLLRKHF